MFYKKSKKIIFIIFILLSLCLKLSLLQPIIIPIEPYFGDDDDEEEDEKEEKAYDDGVKPIIEKRIYQYNDNGTPVTITHISYKSKNLSGNKGVMTPFQIMRSFDNRINSIFEDFFRQSMGIRNILSEMEKDEEDFEKRIKKDFFGDLLDDNNEGKKKKKEGEEVNVDIWGDTPDDEKAIGKKRKIGKFNINNENISKNTSKKKKKLSKKQLIFSRICKYVFYSIILFTVYLLVKKLLEFLEIIDPEDYVEVKINNEPDEEAIKLKTAENKQN